MFWESATVPPQITEETTLEEVLDDDYVVQHVMARCSGVINYLLNADRISRLIEMVIDQSNITFDTVRFKRPSVAAEILSSGVPSLVDFLISTGNQPNAGDNETDTNADSALPNSLPFVDSLLTFVDTSASLNPLSASFFVKIMTNLLYSKASELVPYLRTRRPEFLPNLLRHIESPAICELLIEMTHQDNRQQDAVAQWFIDCDVISQLLDILSSNESSERQESAARCLVELIGIYRNHVAFNAPDKPEEEAISTPTSTTAVDNETPEASLLAKSLTVLDVFESETFLARVLDIISDESSSPTSRNSAIDIFLTCIDKAKFPSGMPPSAGDEYDIPFGNILNTQIPSFMNPLVSKNNCPLLKTRIRRVETLASAAILPRLPKLYSLLSGNTIVSSHYPVMPTTVGVLSPPLGKGRLAIANLISVLPQLRHSATEDGSSSEDGDELRKALCRERFLPCLMHLFETYAFNSLLHKAVTALFRHLLSPPTTESSPSAQQESAKTLAPNTAALPENRNVDSESGKEKDDNSEDADRVNDQLPDYLVRHLLDDCHIIEWILRLSCIPPDRPNDVEKSWVCRASKSRPKPGYSGYLWQIANLVNSRFPSPESLSALEPEVLTIWQAFVRRDLGAINEAQTITRAERSFEKPGPISISGLHIGGPDTQVAQLFRLLQSGTDFQFFNTRLNTPSGGNFSDSDHHLDPNEEVFDHEDDDIIKECVHVKIRRPDDTIIEDDDDDEEEEEEEKREADNDDVGSSNDSTDSSEEEEDLQSPLSIRQQRTNQAPLFLNSTNGQSPFLKSVDTSVPPWSSEVVATVVPSVAAGNSPNFTDTTTLDEGKKGSPVSQSDDWADFESASFLG